MASNADLDRIRCLYADGRTLEEIAALVGRTRSSVEHWLRKRGLCGRRVNKISEAIADAVLQHRRSGKTVEQSAKLAGCTLSVARRVCRAGMRPPENTLKVQELAIIAVAEGHLQKICEEYPARYYLNVRDAAAIRDGLVPGGPERRLQELARRLRPPAYGRHTVRGWGRLWIGGRDHYLGMHNEADSLAAYKRIVKAWRTLADALLKRAADTLAPVMPSGAPGTIGAVAAEYFAHRVLQLKQCQLSPEHFANSTRALFRFCEAWRVSFGPGLVSLVAPENATTADEALAHVTGGLARFLDVGLDQASVTRHRDLAIREASGDDLVRWLDANPQWRSGDAKTNELLAIVAGFAWWEDEPRGVRSPYRRSRLPRFERTSRRDVQVKEYVALMRHTSSQQLRRALYALWNLNGIRTCELRSLCWQDFQWELSCVVLEKHKTRRKTGKAKIVGLTPRMLRFFKALYRQRPAGTEHVFLNTRGLPWTRHSFDHHFARARDALGLAADLTPYCFRHAFATQADEAGADRLQTALLMGHSGPEMIARVYSKIAGKASVVCKAAETVERLRRDARRRPVPGPHAATPTPVAAAAIGQGTVAIELRNGATIFLTVEDLARVDLSALLNKVEAPSQGPAAVVG